MSATLIVVDDLRNDNATESCLYHDALVCVGSSCSGTFLGRLYTLTYKNEVRRGPFHRGNIKSQGPFAHTILADQHELRSSCIGPCWLDWTSHRRYHGLWERHTPYTQPHPQSEERREGDVRCTLVKTADDDAWAVALRMLIAASQHSVQDWRMLSVIINHLCLQCSLGIRFWTGIGSC